MTPNFQETFPSKFHPRWKIAPAPAPPLLLRINVIIIIKLSNRIEYNYKLNEFKILFRTLDIYWHLNFLLVRVLVDQNELKGNTVFLMNHIQWLMLSTDCRLAITKWKMGPPPNPGYSLGRNKEPIHVKAIDSEKYACMHICHSTFSFLLYSLVLALCRRPIIMPK